MILSLHLRFLNILKILHLHKSEFTFQNYEFATHKSKFASKNSKFELIKKCKNIKTQKF